MIDLDGMIPANMTNTHKEVIPWSPLQTAIFQATALSIENLSIEAVAGSGKTTTILECMNHTPGSVLFLAFNRSIVQELRDRTPMGVDCKTFNALGHALLKRKTTGAQLDKWKVTKLLKPMMSSTEYFNWGFDLAKLVSSIKGAGVLEPLSEADFIDYVEHSDVPMNRIEYAAELLNQIWHECLDVSESFTFDDQLYMPIYWDMTFPKYDTIFVDEAQDLNPIKRMMLSQLAERGARIIAVGDSRQAIYGFAGAMTNSMRQLRTKFETVELPLSVCYRCDTAIVKEAQAIVPHILAAEGKPTGTITHSESIAPADINPQSLVMCRTNAPLFRYAMKFLKAKVPCHVTSNLGDQLIKFVKNLKSTICSEMLKEIEKWRKAEIKQAEDRGLNHKINNINEKAQCLKPFCEEYRIKAQVVDALQRLLNSETGATLCTIHKAKGLEADSAYLLRPDLVPAPWIEPETEEYRQEENLLYVAITRAKHELTYIQEEYNEE